MLIRIALAFFQFIGNRLPRMHALPVGFVHNGEHEEDVGAAVGADEGVAFVALHCLNDAVQHGLS